MKKASHELLSLALGPVKSNKFVIGGGWSAGKYDLRNLQKYGTVIGVNDAAIWANVDICVTMDRLWFENRWKYLKARRVAKTFVRRKCDCNVPRVDDRDNWEVFDHEHQHFPSQLPGVLHGGNSGTCAINLAFQRMLPDDRLFLFGFDMCSGPNEEPYWYPPYPWANPKGGSKPGNFVSWATELENFAEYARNKFSVYHITTRTQVKAFPVMSFYEMEGLLNAV